MPLQDLKSCKGFCSLFVIKPISYLGRIRVIQGAWVFLVVGLLRTFTSLFCGCFGLCRCWVLSDIETPLRGGLWGRRRGVLLITLLIMLLMPSMVVTVSLILPLSAALCGLIIKISVLLCRIRPPLRGLGPQPQIRARMPPRLRVSILLSASAQLLPFGTVAYFCFYSPLTDVK